jgi:hypothetical protein
MHSVLRLRSWERLQIAGIRRSQLHYANLSITLFHLLVEYGEVPCTRCTLLAEKVNFLDAFKEVAYLLEDFATELVLLFVRTCFLLLRSDKRQGEFAFKLTNSLQIVLVVEWNMGFFRSKL